MLPTRAEEIITALPRVGDYVFLGRSGKHLRDLRSIWRRVRKAAGLPTLRLYDARHSWISTAAALGIPDDVRRLLSGHQGRGGSHSVYLHPLPEVRAAADRVADRLTGYLFAPRPGPSAA